jgi:hypothetical protein
MHPRVLCSNFVHHMESVAGSGSNGSGFVKDTSREEQVSKGTDSDDPNAFHFIRSCIRPQLARTCLSQ